MRETLSLPNKSPARIAGMFDAIARRYDFLNHLLSVGLDRRWRARAITELRLTGEERVVDACTGTADLAIAAVTAPHGRASKVIGVDFAAAMLREGARKLQEASLNGRIALVRGDAANLPIADASTEAAMVAFGIRNVENHELACRELNRVLKPHGRLAILEFGEPRIPGVRQLYLAYFRYLLPLIGRFVSHHRHAYGYLPASVSAFPSPQLFVAVLSRVGFSRVRAISLTFGVVYLYLAEKSP